MTVWVPCECPGCSHTDDADGERLADGYKPRCTECGAEMRPVPGWDLR